MSISYRRLLIVNKTIEFHFEVIVVVLLSFYLHCRFHFFVFINEKEMLLTKNFVFIIVNIKNTVGNPA